MGSGLQNKLLEAMAMNVPSITSSIANNSLKATNNQEIIVCEQAEEYAQSIIGFLSNPSLADTISQHAFSFVNDHFDWKYQVEQLSQIIHTAMEKNGQSTDYTHISN
jgi:glycosyltransferase involved in cell wall biosynthesis